MFALSAHQSVTPSEWVTDTNVHNGLSKGGEKVLENSIDGKKRLGL